MKKSEACTNASHATIKSNVELLTTMTRPIAPQRDRAGNVLVYLCLCLACDSSLGIEASECNEAMEAFFRLTAASAAPPAR